MFPNVPTNTPNFMNVQPNQMNAANGNQVNPLSNLLGIVQQNAQAQQAQAQEQQLLNGLTMLANPNIFSMGTAPKLPVPPVPKVEKKCFGCGKFLKDLTDHTNASDCPVRLKKEMDKMRSMMAAIKQEQVDPLLPIKQEQQASQPSQPGNSLVPFNAFTNQNTQMAPPPTMMSQQQVQQQEMQMPNLQFKLDELADKMGERTIKTIEEVLTPISAQIGDRFKEVNDNLLDLKTQMPLLKSDLAETKGKVEALEKLIGEVGKVTSRNDTAIGHLAGEVTKLAGKASAKPVLGRAKSMSGGLTPLHSEIDKSKKKKKKPTEADEAPVTPSTAGSQSARAARAEKRGSKE